ncbi:hypothetical protein [Frondihabitans australicus]|uniref:Uncharacterized protein n=1 Tax=Frondihabitans australicus TaxID=386892 RepID=A0A495IJB5_9MICO|nr:hypothetical protein [Frondihabitans australicus]RKR76063.1 hypothetical protein C8E83_3227 [Frondihabitans australicus]
MAAVVGETTGRSPVPRATLLWLGLGALVVVLFFVTIAVLNSTVYSASGFAKSYVDAINRGDTASALALAGVQPTGASGDELLTVSEKGAFRSVRVVGDVTERDGDHRVAVTYETTTGAQEQTIRFTIRPSGTFGGLFGRWEFATPPTASIDVTPRNDPRFTADGVEVTTKGADLATRYTVLAPAAFTLSHSSTYLTARDTTVSADAVGQVVSAAVDVEPRASFTAKVRADVTKYLRTDCLPQKVLLPSGCPFGESVDDRLTGDPTWTMATYPAVSLQPTATAGVWDVVAATGVAHLNVGAESLYDGHDYTIDKNVPFRVSYQVTIGSDNGLTITPK